MQLLLPIYGCMLRHSLSQQQASELLVGDSHGCSAILGGTGREKEGGPRFRIRIQHLIRAACRPKTATA
mgnify:CR=1 FL=1